MRYIGRVIVFVSSLNDMDLYQYQSRELYIYTFFQMTAGGLQVHTVSVEALPSELAPMFSWY